MFYWLQCDYTEKYAKLRRNMRREKHLKYKIGKMGNLTPFEI